MKLMKVKEGDKTIRQRLMRLVNQERNGQSRTIQIDHQKNQSIRFNSSNLK